MTLTLALLVVSLPHGSVPVQRRVTVALQAGPLVTVSSTTALIDAPQLSVNVGAVKLTRLRHCTGPLPLPPVATTGAVVSSTVTLALLVVALPHGSGTSQHTISYGVWSSDVCSSDLTTALIDAPQLSVNVGAVKLTRLRHCKIGRASCRERVTVAVVSSTVKKEQLVVALPHGSVPVQRRVTGALQAGPLVPVTSTGAL